MAPKDRSIFINSKPAKTQAVDRQNAIRIPSDSEYLSRTQVHTRGGPAMKSTCGICSVPAQKHNAQSPDGGAATSSEFLSGSRKRPPREKHPPSSHTLPQMPSCQWGMDSKSPQIVAHRVRLPAPRMPTRHASSGAKAHDARPPRGPPLWTPSPRSCGY